MRFARPARETNVPSSGLAFGIPELDVLLVPIGGGGLISGIAVAAKTIKPGIEVIGVQAEGSSAFARSWRTGTRVVGEQAATFAEGMATRVTFDLPFAILQRELDDVVTLTEDELAEGVRLALRATHNLAEGAGAASLAAAMKLRDRLAGRTVACVMSGGNIDAATLRRVLDVTATAGSSPSPS